MHDFMQSLQMRCPVPAHIGLSITTIPSAPIGLPFCFDDVHLRNLLFERATRQGYTENAVFVFPGLLAQSGRATVFALVMALDAVVGFVQRSLQIMPGSVSWNLHDAEMIGMKLEFGDTVQCERLHRYQMIRVDLVGHLEENVFGVLLLAAGVSVAHAAYCPARSS